MTDSRAAVGLDRLPWLTDEPKARPRAARRSSLRELIGWGIAGAMLLAGGSYWLGRQSAGERDRIDAPAPRTSQPRPEATIALPDPRPLSPQPEVAIEPAPAIVPPVASEVRVAAPSVARRAPAARRPPRERRRTLSQIDPKGEALERAVAEQEGTAVASDQNAPAATSLPAPVVAMPTVSSPRRAATPANRYRNGRSIKAKPARQQPLRLWPSRQSAGASGRLVQIGAFGSRQQAKLGWRRMTRSYPAVGRLPAVVVEARNSRGKPFYRFQIGTTSQAHSEVLCQRMQSINYSCAVVGLPWKPKVER